MPKGKEEKVGKPADAEKKTKGIKKAKQVAKTSKKGQHLKRKHKIRTKVRFYRPKTFQPIRTPKYTRNTKDLIPRENRTDGFDKFAVIKYPLNTEKAMKKIEDENTIVFIVDSRASKPAIKQAFFQIYSTKVRNVNTLIRPDGKKKAYIRLGAESDALNLANKIGII